MRHRIRKAKLGRTTEHRTSLLANLVSNLIKHRRIRTTLAKAKAARVVADKMVPLPPAYRLAPPLPTPPSFPEGQGAQRRRSA